jgi:hypothetical protein
MEQGLEDQADRRKESGMERSLERNFRVVRRAAKIDHSLFV